MNSIQYFINKPVTATILNFIILLVGLLGFKQLTVKEYPSVSIPVLTVETRFPNASSETVEKNIVEVQENYLSGINGLEFILSKAKDQLAKIDLHFKPNTDIDVALAQVREGLSLARANLPKQAEAPVISSERRNNDGFMFFLLKGKNKNHNPAELTHIAKLNIESRLKAVENIAAVEVMGQRYQIEILVDREKLFQHKISPDTLVEIINRNNLTLPAGKLNHVIPITFDLNLKKVEDFENIIIQENNNSFVYLKDLADIKVSVSNSEKFRFNEQPAIILKAVEGNDANILELSSKIKSILPEIRNNLPKDLDFNVIYDKSEFVEDSLSSVYRTIIEAIIFVSFIILVFLRSFIATFIPLLTIPISIIGVMAFLHFFGFTINIITLLAIVIAIGLVVDDAIVVLENIDRHKRMGKNIATATVDATKEIGFAIIAMTFTLASVFIPIGFLPGVVGQLFREFAVTLSGAVIISGITALTFTPMISCRWLKNSKVGEKVVAKERKTWFSSLLTYVLQIPKTITILLLSIILFTLYMYDQLPYQLVPDEDRSLVGIYMQAPPGVSLNEFDEYVKNGEGIVKQIDERESMITVVLENNGFVVVPLVKKHERTRSASEIEQHIRKSLQGIPSVDAFAWNNNNGLPGVQGMGAASGVNIQIKTLDTYESLAKTINQIRQAFEKEGLKNVYSTMKLDTPTVQATLNHEKMELVGLKPETIAKAIEIMFDKFDRGYYYLDGIRYNIVLANKTEISKPEELYLFNNKKEQISLDSIASFQKGYKPRELVRYNRMRSSLLTVPVGENMSMGETLEMSESILKQHLPMGYYYEMTKETKKLKESSRNMEIMFLLAVVFIYCVLAIQFESFVDPLIILLTVPLAAFGALFTLYAANDSMNIFSQIGIITLIGLITKHGILIIEFINRELSKSTKVFDAVRFALLKRFRPIIMTTMAMILGSLPLVLSTGPGSEARRSIGLVLFGGLSFGTVFTLILFPIVCLIVKNIQHQYFGKMSI